MCCLERGCDNDELFDRLDTMLDDDRHVLLRLTAELPSPHCWFEHDAQLNALMLELMGRAPRDLVSWPGKGRDQPLYSLGPLAQR